jgi:hypothetical protein
MHARPSSPQNLAAVSGVRAHSYESSPNRDRPVLGFAEPAENLASSLDGHGQLPKVIIGVEFTNPIEVRQIASSSRRCLISLPHLEWQ